MANWTKDDIVLVEKFIAIKNKGLYADGTQLTDAYNRILGKNLRPTNCGACIRSRIQELENALNTFKAMNEKLKKEQEETEKVLPEPEKETEQEDVTSEKVTETENVTPKKETKKTGTKKK